MNYTTDLQISTHMPLARHDAKTLSGCGAQWISTHMPLARHDKEDKPAKEDIENFYSHASCEA